MDITRIPRQKCILRLPSGVSDDTHKSLSSYDHICITFKFTYNLQYQIHVVLSELCVWSLLPRKVCSAPNPKSPSVCRSKPRSIGFFKGATYKSTRWILSPTWMENSQTRNPLSWSSEPACIRETWLLIGGLHVQGSPVITPTFVPRQFWRYSGGGVISGVGICVQLSCHK
jgi:hypothetical protein